MIESCNHHPHCSGTDTRYPRTFPSETGRESENCNLGSCSSGLTLLETLPAIHRAALRGFEWNCGFTLAAGTDCLGFYALVITPTLLQAKRLRALPLTALAAFRFVLELLIVEEELFTCGEHEVGATVHTLKDLVLELH